MSASRASSMRSLKYLSSHGRQVWVRRLHLTGPAEYASPLLASSERPKVNIPKDVPGLQAECARRHLPTAGSLAELTDRLTTDLHARGFSTAIEKDQKRPKPSAVDAAPAQPTRHFNTSRVLKTVNDSSTIDFAYLPESVAADSPSAFAARVPLLPQVNFSSPRAQVLEPETPEPAPMRPEISTVSADTTYFHPPSALSDVTDNSSIDFHGISESSLKPRAAGSNSEVAGFKQFWNGLLDDVFGPKTIPAAR
ncbi:uncharacterized protein IWZ02DRAFT_496301 [Phyllosticta citriasiana]|uniref:Uncharacterized protein n=1 Tax=Phyllosticta citriasiana TaxID=595635 RepID=A0ABR1KXP7_9PEZI